ncbi:hypothetical protein GCM10028791_10810 [Echinicola sediminis]
MEAITNILENFFTIIIEKLASWIKLAIEMLPNFLVAILITLAFVLLAKLVRNIFHRFLSKISDSKSLNTLFSTVVYILVISAGVFIALSVLKLDKAVTSLLAGAGIIGLALGFAFQDIASNFMSGVIMAVRKPIRTGHLVETNGIFGTVQRVSLRATEIKSPQGQLYIVPNKMIFENPIKNYTASGERRVDLACGVSYGDDLKKVKEVTLQAIESLATIDKEKGISLYFKEFGDSSINYQVRYWVKDSTSQADFLEATSQGIIAIKDAYDKNGIDIPFPIRTLDFGIKGGEKLSEMMPLEIKSNSKEKE